MGGATRGADLNALNLAAKVEDGRQVVVPRRVVPAGGNAGAAAGATGADGDAGEPVAGADARGDDGADAARQVRVGARAEHPIPDLRRLVRGLSAHCSPLRSSCAVD